MATHSRILAWRIPCTDEPAVHGVPESWTRLKPLSRSRCFSVNVGWRNEQKVWFHVHACREGHCLPLALCRGLRGGQLLKLLMNSQGPQISESFGPCPRAASPSTRTTDFMSLRLMRWNSQTLGPQLPVAL